MISLAMMKISLSISGQDILILVVAGNMSQSSSSSASACTLPGCIFCDSYLVPFTFGPNGQPIWPNSSNLCALIEQFVKTHVAPAFPSWNDVPDALKDQVWQIVSNMYTVSSSHKQWVLRKANATWKNWKSSLRRNVYDKYLTDAERRAHVPPYVRQEDWEIFVDMCSTPEVQASREMGRAAKSASRSPHTSGRKGQAGVVEELRQQNLDKEVSCTYIWIATHTRKGGLVSSQQLDAINRIYVADNFVAQRDLKNDAVAMVFGCDSQGHVSDMGMGVPKIATHHFAPNRRALADEQASHTDFQTQVTQLRATINGLRRELEDLKQSLSQGGT
eukprot:TRINITY_DN2396_c1_g1_i15.p1 TRINITY_DN2396_c1_g1~~TRINITY_DN2396_c1_g1_i15.p1  ORF type:complete len:332 (-),score=42.02 TRINITY_DN2396_c1_g1_i15:434-1429(-)